ncbi:TIGR04053 family radical SAM/SPASM domain-containing protein [Halomarina pelagica]|uniref:TIGR04053 family radical SAM/SPASM domain-containing protein n=1 Tax=Halomarina pelagica TaxID=2961599 RepID=UPI0020C4DA46|nr:TIGR04053 family radical SAM/SPASM domain-containing protein [Halomarina sp. BND7]
MNPRTIDTSRRPFVLIWELTQACALACKHCRADARPHRHPDELTTSEGKRLLDDARRFGDSQLVVLSGGDPLARDDTVELVDYGTDVGLRMTLTPSGTTSLTGERIEALADAGLRRMALSVDGGTATSHDEFRRERGSFDQTVRAARNARAAGLPLQINTTVCAETVDELPAIRDLVADLDAVLWSVFFLVPVGRGSVLEPISPEAAERVMEWLCAVSETSPFGVKTTEAPHYRRVAIERSGAERAAAGGDAAGGDPTARDGTKRDPTGRDGEGRPGRPADGIGRRAGITAGDGFAFVSHTGEVYPSGFLPRSAGNVRDEGIVEPYRHSELFRSLRDRGALRGKCGACPYRYVCGGSRSRAYAYTDDPLESDPLCAYVPDGYDGPLPATQQG